MRGCGGRRPDSSPERGFTVAGQRRAHTGLRCHCTVAAHGRDAATIGLRAQRCQTCIAIEVCRYGRLGHMHLVPADRADHRSIDGHRACQAIGALGDPENIAIWAQRFSLLADPGQSSQSRMELLTIADEEAEHLILNKADEVIFLPKVPEYLQPLVAVVPLRSGP